MTHLTPLTKEDAQPEVQQIFDNLNKKIGMVPNIYAAMGNSPAALKAILGFGEALKSGEFSPKEVEAVALVIAQENDCSYCLSVHTAIGKMVGFTEEETVDLRKTKSEDEQLVVLTQLAKDIVKTKGYPSKKHVDRFFEVGYSKATLVELIGFVALNVFTNYFNHIVETEADFPEYQKI